MKLTDSDIARFWQRVDRSGGPHACWPWIPLWGKKTEGYGSFYVNGVSVRATHVALTLEGRPEPSDPELRGLHTCHYPPCTNPLHLYWGTQKENMRDMLEAGRGNKAYGERFSKSKLRAEEVYDIRRLYDETKRMERGRRSARIGIAKRFDISIDNVLAIGRRKTWKHLPERG